MNIIKFIDKVRNIFVLIMFIVMILAIEAALVFFGIGWYLMCFALTGLLSVFAQSIVFFCPLFYGQYEIIRLIQWGKPIYGRLKA